MSQGPLDAGIQGILANAAGVKYQGVLWTLWYSIPEIAQNA